MLKKLKHFNNYLLLLELQLLCQQQFNEILTDFFSWKAKLCPIDPSVAAQLRLQSPLHISKLHSSHGFALPTLLKKKKKSHIQFLFISENKHGNSSNL